MGILLIVIVVYAALCPRPTEGQYYCNGRATITAQWGGCNGTEAVCSYLMQAITTTWNWWATVNNTNGSSLGVAVHNFFTTDAYGQLLSFTNNNTAYPTVCMKIAKIVAQLLIWNATKDANVILGNATYAATARQELFNTIIPNWGYTIGQYIACGATCTNYTSTTSTTAAKTTTNSTSTTPPHYATTTTNPLNICPAPTNTSGVVYTNVALPVSFNQPTGGCACNVPYGEQLFVPGLNTQGGGGGGPVNAQCNGYGEACFCSQNGSCYRINGTSNEAEYVWLYLSPLCPNDGTGGGCVTYLSKCYTSGNEAVYDAANGQLITTCDAINAIGAPVGICPGVNCTSLPVAYVSCGACPAGGVLLQLNCAGPYTPECVGAPQSLSSTCGLVVTQPSPTSHENFPVISIEDGAFTGNCSGCASPDQTQYFFNLSSSVSMTCQNGTNSSQLDWTGLCLCSIAGACYHLANASALTNVVTKINLEYGEACTATIKIYCNNVTVAFELVDGSRVPFSPDAGYSCIKFGYQQYELTLAAISCNGCPNNQPPDLFCPGSYTPD